MTESYIEAILVWSEKGAATTVNNWFVDKGFQVMPMLNGLLISGGQSEFKKVFRIESVRSEQLIVLPIPDELAGHVDRITIAKPRQF